MKVDRKNYKGIEYILFDELPQAQREKFLQASGHGAFIKILIDGKVISRCIQYKDYNLWFENMYKVKPGLLQEERVQNAVELTSNLALHKA